MNDIKCDCCGKQMQDYFDVGYDGPKNRNDQTCNPFVEWQVLCRECEEKKVKPRL